MVDIIDLLENVDVEGVVVWLSVMGWVEIDVDWRRILVVVTVMLNTRKILSKHKNIPILRHNICTKCIASAGN